MFSKKQNEENPTPPAAPVPNLAALDQPASAAEKKAPLPVPPGALNPEMIAYINATLAETVKSVFASMTPVLRDLALTPEKIAQAEALRRAPDAAQVEREQREKKLQHLEMEENRENQRRAQESCGHRYANGALSVSRVSNFPDRQPRFTCHLCGLWCHPREWEILPPTKDEPRGVPRIRDAHPLYAAFLKELSVRG
jgi:hypothetical protein